MLFHLETNSKSGKIYLLATMKYTWCAYLSPPFTVINYYSNIITILLSFKSLKLSRFCFFLITRRYVTFTIIIYNYYFCLGLLSYFVQSFSFYSNFITMLLCFKSGNSVDSVISVIVKTVFVLMLLFDMGKVCRTKIFTKT